MYYYPQKQDDDDDESNTGDITKTLDSMYLEDVGKISDEELFKQPPSQYGDCPICFLRLPTLNSGWRYMSCCGKEICSGCFFAEVHDNQGQGNIVAKRVCPFCRTPTPSSVKEAIKREKKRVDLGDPMAIYNHGVYYREGEYSFSIDHTEALELFHRAAELGHTDSYNSIGASYDCGDGVGQVILVMQPHMAILVMHMIMVKGWKKMKGRPIVIMN